MTLVDGQMLISNSEVQSFKRCRRKWMLEWHRALKPTRSELLGARPTGTRIHEVLADYYDPATNTPLDIAPLHERDYGLILAQYGGVEYVPDFVAADWKKASDLEKAMISGYREWLAETGADEGLQVVATETALQVPFDVPGVPVPVLLIGKLDMRATISNQFGVTKVFYDHKTCADFARKTATIQQDEQVLHYQLLERLAFPGEPRVTGAVFNLLRKVKRTGTAKPPFFQRVSVEHSTVEIANYERKLRAVIRDIWQVSSQLAAGVEHNDTAYPTPADSCGYSCDFKPVCGMMDDGSHYEAMLDDLYTTRNPLDRYADKDAADD